MELTQITWEEAKKHASLYELNNAEARVLDRVERRGEPSAESFAFGFPVLVRMDQDGLRYYLMSCSETTDQ